MDHVLFDEERALRARVIPVLEPCREQRRHQPREHDRRDPEPVLVREVLDLGLQRHRRGEPGVRIAGQRAHHDRLERRRVARHELAGPRRVGAADLQPHAGLGLIDEGQSPGRQLVQDRADREHIAAAIHRTPAARLLRRQVRDLALQHRSRRDRLAGRARDPEIDDLHGAVVADDHVGRRHVAVDHADGLAIERGLLVRVVQPGA